MNLYAKYTLLLIAMLTDSNKFLGYPPWHVLITLSVCKNLEIIYCLQFHLFQLKANVSKLPCIYIMQYTKSLKKCLFGIVTCRFGIVTHMQVWNCHSHVGLELSHVGLELSLTCRFGIVTCRFGIVTCRNSGQEEDGKKVFQLNLINPSDKMLSIFRRIFKLMIKNKCRKFFIILTIISFFFLTH